MTKSSMKHELIVVLVNQGFADAVIEAARANGCSGGTVLNAKGKSSKSAEKKYGFVIAPEKDLLFLLVNNKNKTRVMHAINKVAGIETDGMAIVFSIPANNVLGISNLGKNKK